METLESAKQIVMTNLGEGAEIKGVIEHEGDFLFLATWDDPHEGRFDPFFKVNKNTGAFRDFSPQDYDNPREIIDPLVAQANAA